jgi:hypothetical protein
MFFSLFHLEPPLAAVIVLGTRKKVMKSSFDGRWSIITLDARYRQHKHNKILSHYSAVIERREQAEAEAVRCL